MSQIRKLQNGGSTYGNLTINGRTTNDPKEIERWISGLSVDNPESAAISGRWASWIRSGVDADINTTDNTITFAGKTVNDYADLPGATKRQLNILVSGKPTYGGNNFSTAFRNNIFNAGRFTFPDSEEQQKSNKTKVSNGQIKVDYDTVDGVQKYSSNPSNALIKPQIKAYLDYLSDEKWGETNEWENSLGDNDRILKAWYSGFKGDRNAAQAAIDTALNEVRTKPWNEVSEASRELLAYFNIIGPDASKTGASTTSTSYIDENGQVKKNSQNERGQWGVYDGTGENGTIKGARYTTYDSGTTPYLINADRLGLFEGLDDSYLNSIIYNGRIYRPNEIGQNVQLQQLMDEITHINNNAISPIQAYEQLKGKFNYTDYPDSLGNYGMYDASKHYIDNKAVRDYLTEKGISNAALFNATAGYNVDDGSTIYGVYDYSHSGTGPYGFRTPFYLIVGADGQLHLTEGDENGVQHRHWTSIPYESSGRNYGDANGLIRAKEVINGKTYGRLEVTDRVDGSSYHFVIDENGKVYHVTNKGKIEPIDDELATRILNGEQIVPGDVDDSKKRARKQEKYQTGWRPPITGRKQGGKIRELPVKLQMGSRLLATPTTVEENTPIDDRMSDASTFSAYKWDELSDADKNDVRAVGLDLLGAILALSPDPYTSAAGLASGLGATSLMTAADVQRGDFKLGRTALSAGMDVLGAVPYIGSAAKLTKVGKFLTKSPKIWKHISNAFIAAGFANAVPTLDKLVHEGPKSLTTDDLYALSGAVQASLGVGVRARQRKGDSQLANLISEKSKTVTTPETPKVKEVEVKLKPEDVTEITEAKGNAGQKLREKLEANKDIDKKSLDSDNNELLKKFGFEVEGENVKVAEGATHTAKVAAKETAVAKAADKVTNAAKRILPGKDNYSKNGYITDLFKGAQKRRDYIDTQMQNEAVRQEIDAALASLKEGEGKLMKRAYGRSQFRIGEEPKTDGRWFSYQKETKPEETITEQTPVQQQSTPQQQSNIQVPPGRSDERVEVQRVIESPIKSPEEIPAELRTEQLSLPNAERIALPQNSGEAAIAIRPETGLVKTGKTYKVASMEKRAANLRRLQNSRNPLKTLSDLEKQNSDKLFTNEEEFNALIESLIRKNAATRGNNTKSGEKYIKDVVRKMKDIRDSGRAYKHGGILKGETGLELPDELKKQWGISINKPNINEYIPTEIDPGQVKETLPGDSLGFRYKNWNGLGNIVQPILSGVRYFSQMHGRNKSYAEQKAALNAGRVNRQSISLPTVPTYSTAHQHLENQLNQQMMNGIKPIASDLSAYYAAKLQQQAALNNGLRDITAQKSQYEQQANIQNQQLKSQEALQNNEIAFENAKMNASINSGLHQLEAAKLAEEQASRDNLLYEIQQKLYQDQQTMMQGSIAARNQKNAAAYQGELQRVFPNEWAKWQTVDQTKYGSFEDYVSSVNPTLYNQKKVDLENFKDSQNNELIRTTIQGRMNYPWLYGRTGGYHGPAGFKKGGRVNGTTRYTLEPDERIWIDNNKAAHAKAAKLNDAAIKLLLRALK